MRRRIILLPILLFVSTFILSGSSTAGALTSAANTLKVSPVRTDIEVEPGKSAKINTIITNLTDAPIQISPIQNDFVAGDERGTPALILDADKYAPTHSLKRFLAPLKDVTVPANESVAVEVVINVPMNAQAGGYFGAIRFAPASLDRGGQVNASASVASIILLTVSGDPTEKLDLTNFDIRQRGKTATFFGDSRDLQLAVRFKNSGSIQEGPFGKIAIKQGDKVVYQTDFNNKTPRDVILPDSARRWDVSLKNLSNFGHYTVSATFTYGKKNQTIQVDKSFWVIPTTMIILASIGLLLLIMFIISISLLIKRRRHSRKSKHNTLSRRR
jgi:hypothetical protein